MSENELTIPDMTRQQIELIKRTIAKGATDDELALFIQFCRSKKMDPFSRHLYAIQRREKDERGNYHSKMVIQTGIDGFRAQAGRNPHYAGQLGPFWCGPDGIWADVWLSSEAPLAAKVGALRDDFKEPCWGVARWVEYKSDKGLWEKMPAVMLAKCAEALALRRAFPDELSGIYSTDEMDQAIDITAFHADVVTPIQASEAGVGQREEIGHHQPPSRPAPAPVQAAGRMPVQPVESGGDVVGSRGSEQPVPAGEASAAAGNPSRQVLADVQAVFPQAKLVASPGKDMPVNPEEPLASEGQRKALVKMARHVMGGKTEGNAWLQQAGATSMLSLDLFKHLMKQLMDTESAMRANVKSFDEERQRRFGHQVPEVYAR